jgi:hypothetical protein
MVVHVTISTRSRKVLGLELLSGLLSIGIMTSRTLAFVFPSQGSRAMIGLERVTSRSFCPSATRHYSSSTVTALPASVTGTVYTVEDEGAPKVRLFTKEGCTLCDEVKDILVSVRDACPHSLEAVDITDTEQADWYERYKYDIPVLHINGHYWIKHRITAEEAVQGMTKAKQGTFHSASGEPDAGALERKQAERLRKD